MPRRSGNPSAAALRKRRLRDRQRRGVICPPVDVDLEVRETMIEAGYLEPAAANDAKQVASALAQLLRDWRRRWTAESPFGPGAR